MRGKVRSVSLARKLVIDVMHAAIPLVIDKRMMKFDRLVQARAACAARTGWRALFVKAFCIVALDEPWLGTLYLR